MSVSVSVASLFKLCQSVLSNQLTIKTIKSATVTGLTAPLRRTPLTLTLRHLHFRSTVRHPHQQKQKPPRILYLLLPFPVKVLLTPASCDEGQSNCTSPPATINTTSPSPDTTATPTAANSPPPVCTLPDLPQYSNRCGPACSQNCDQDHSKNPSKPIPVKWCEPAELSHEVLVRQACQLTVDSVTRILSETVAAYQDYHEKYRCMLDALMEGLELTRTSHGTQLELLDCKIIMLRAEVDQMKHKMSELEGFMGSAQRLAEATAETAYLGHAEYHSVAMSERVQSIVREMRSIKEITLRKERDMVELQSVVIVESGRSLR